MYQLLELLGRGSREILILTIMIACTSQHGKALLEASAVWGVPLAQSKVPFTGHAGIVTRIAK